MALNKNIYKIRGAPYKIWNVFASVVFVVDKKAQPNNNKLSREARKTNKDFFTDNTKTTVSHGILGH